MCLLCRRNSNVEFMELNKRERETKGQREREHNHSVMMSFYQKKQDEENRLRIQYVLRHERESVCVQEKNRIHSFVIFIKETRKKMILSLCLWYLNLCL